ncbi:MULTISPECIES: DUF4124 domain-containing protein [unclassified Janthinobacterium]|uniref:DUF4124 domain-containing protein n=1 Tax=unclassified Janthinobacterium TaxID=2610881 RepID=UPI000346E151|nr:MULTISPECIES: DUF4124 domain-containing protein [unclassified Janthinobacterium]MEC5160593.1 hypothetical protein [Janthinobacterium sp. CG_S6]
MNRPAFTTTLFLSCMMAASAAMAGSEIVKCVDVAGHVVLTDQPCEGGTQIALTPAAAPVEAAAEAPVAPASAVRTVTLERFAATTQGRPRVVLAKRAAMPTMSADAATLRAARLNMQASDHASSLMRQQRLAGLN